MDPRDTYIALVSSLPRSERLFVAKRPPLSRLRLDKRLAVLSEPDRARLALMERLMSWGAYGMADAEDESIRRAELALDRLDSATLEEIVRERMDIRATLAALRMRRDGAGPPAAPWSASGLVRRIARNWAEPTFGLQRRMPWLPQAVALLEAGDPLGLERHILDVTFLQLQRHDARHVFDFEAVAIYVLKWSIFDRWARSDARAATARFAALADAALADTPELAGIA